MPTITLPNDYPLAPVLLSVNDAAGHFVLGVIHGTTPGTAEVAVGVVYLLKSDMTVEKEIGRSEPFGKDNGLTFAIIGTTVRLVVTQSTPGGAGTTSIPSWYDFPNAVPAAVPVTAADPTARQQAAAALTAANTAAAAANALGLRVKTLEDRPASGGAALTEAQQEALDRMVAFFGLG